MNKKLNLILFFILAILTSVASRVGAVPSTSHQRIVSLAPNITEILFALNLDESIVGVTDFCNYPPQAQTRVKVGGYLNLNLEVVLALKPTLVVMLSYQKSLKHKLDALQISSLTVKSDNIEDILDAIIQIGAATERMGEAQTLTQTITQRLNWYQRRLAETPPKTVLFIIGRNPGTLEGISAVGGKSFLNQLIEYAGGKNIFADFGMQYPKVTQEEIVARNPMIIVEALPFSNPTAVQLERHRQAWQQLSSLQCVQNRQIFLLENDYTLIPGPRILLIVEQLLKIIHPDIYDEMRANHEP
ncbi:MAG: helical backbone metal receptor [candidate division KSB1 bacterium]|nr:helical backbone metal receptor [candidate division KSB1 bacterium]MDZ7341704.1 helical backbone metal receptor [candidate division KSB1 bacterium]